MHSTKLLKLSTLVFLVSSSAVFSGDKSITTSVSMPLLASPAAGATHTVSEAIPIPAKRASSTVSPRTRSVVAVAPHSFPLCVALFASEAGSVHLATARPLTPVLLTKTSSQEATTYWPC